MTYAYQKVLAGTPYNTAGIRYFDIRMTYRRNSPHPFAVGRGWKWRDETRICVEIYSAPSTLLRWLLACKWRVAR